MSIIKTSTNGHVAIFTFPYGSHPWPLFKLSCRLATAAPDIVFSFFNTRKSNNSLLSSSLSSSSNQLPGNMKMYDVNDVRESDRDSSLNEVEMFMRATPENFLTAMHKAVEETNGTQITCLLTDSFLLFSADIAAELNVPWFAFWIPSIYSLSADIYAKFIKTIFTDQHQTLEAIPGLSLMRMSDLPGHILIETESIVSSLINMIMKLGKVLPRADAVIINSYREINTSLLVDDLGSKFQLLLFPGLLTVTFPPPPLPMSESDTTGCLSWLDEQKERSTVYVCFGTVAQLSSDELEAIADVLAQHEVPFLWSLRDEFKNNLPKEFFEKTLKFGKMVSWAPQNEILNHNSTGVYVTHCGYNSVFESIAGEVPMICRPVWTDNHMNARLVEELWEIGVKVEGGKITKSGFSKCLDLVFGDEKGKKMRENIKNLKEVLVKAAGPESTAAKDFQALVKLMN